MHPPLSSSPACQSPPPPPNLTSSNSTNSVIVAAVEGGGTSFKVAVVRLPVPSTHSSSDDHDHEEDECPWWSSEGGRCSGSNCVEILHEAQFASDSHDPELCLSQCADFFRRHNKKHQHHYQHHTTATATDTPPRYHYAALGVACFGPLGLNNASSNADNYGCILASSPKAQWRGVNVLAPLIRACSSSNSNSSCDSNDSNAANPLYVKIETDVNAPALLEYAMANFNSPGKKKKISSCAYITVGTGVGVGLVVNDQCVHGRMHPEAGHTLIQPILPIPIATTSTSAPSHRHSFEGYSWGSTCPFFGKHTVEGTASTVALTERWHWMRKNHQNPHTNHPYHDTSDRSILVSVPDGDEDEDHVEACELWDVAAHAIACLCVQLLLMVSVEKIVLGGGLLTARSHVLLPRIYKRVLVHMNGYVPMPQYEDMSELICVSSLGSQAGLYGAIALARTALLEGQQQQSKRMHHQEKETKEKEKEIKSLQLQKIKQVAFQHGLWYGIWVGVVGMALAVRSVDFVSLWSRQYRSKR